jgi:hypothetical protein
MRRMVEYANLAMSQCANFQGVGVKICQSVCGRLERLRWQTFLIFSENQVGSSGRQAVFVFGRIVGQLTCFRFDISPICQTSKAMGKNFKKTIVESLSARPIVSNLVPSSFCVYLFGLESLAAISEGFLFWGRKVGASKS